MVTEDIAAIDNLNLSVAEAEEPEELEILSSSTLPRESDLAPTETRDQDEIGWNEDVVRQYLHEASRVPLLDQATVIELAKAMERGRQAAERLEQIQGLSAEECRELRQQITEGLRARQRLIESNLRLVVSVARRFRGRGLAFADLIQEGNLGLMRAVEKYDHTLGYRLTTYAVWWIRQAIQRALADTGRTIRLPVHTIEELARIEAAERRIAQQQGEPPELVDLARELGVSEGRISELRRVAQPTASLDRPIGSEESSSLGDFVPDDGPSPVDEASAALLRDEVDAALDRLTPRERRVLEMRFGLYNGERCSLEAVGAELGVTRERARQLEIQALQKLRHPAVASRLREFLN